jgi:hypothetical protein
MVSRFDEALHLAAWNRNFQELFQLPDEFLDEQHDFDNCIRYLTEPGEFCETDPDGFAFKSQPVAVAYISNLGTSFARPQCRDRSRHSAGTR